MLTNQLKSVWLDDVREMPAEYDTLVTRAEDAIDLLRKGEVKRISLDHDLGENSGTGYDVARYIEQAAHEGTLSPLEVSIHTANPVGRQNIVAAIRSAYKAWLRLDNA